MNSPSQFDLRVPATELAWAYVKCMYCYRINPVQDMDLHATVCEAYPGYTKPADIRRVLAQLSPLTPTTRRRTRLPTMARQRSSTQESASPVQENNTARPAEVRRGISDGESAATLVDANAAAMSPSSWAPACAEDLAARFPVVEDSEEDSESSESERSPRPAVPTSIGHANIYDVDAWPADQRLPTRFLGFVNYGLDCDRDEQKVDHECSDAELVRPRPYLFVPTFISKLAARHKTHKKT